MNKINITNVILTIIAILCMFIVIFCDNIVIDRYIIVFQWVIIFTQIGLQFSVLRKYKSGTKGVK